MREVLNKLGESITLTKVNETSYRAEGLDKSLIFDLTKQFKDDNGEDYSISNISDELLILEMVKRVVANKFIKENGLNPMEIRIIEFVLFGTLESVVMSQNIVNGVKEVLVG